jgi:hypothetical protein
MLVRGKLNNGPTLERLDPNDIPMKLNLMQMAHNWLKIIGTEENRQINDHDKFLASI